MPDLSAWNTAYLLYPSRLEKWHNLLLYKSSHCLQPCYITFVFIGVDVMQTVECVCWHVRGLQYLPGAPIHNIQPYLQVSVFTWVIKSTPICMTARCHKWISILNGSSYKFFAIENSCYMRCLYMNFFKSFTFSSLSYSNKSFTMGCPRRLLSNRRITLTYIGCSKKTK